MTNTYIATIQVVLRPDVVDSVDAACDWFSGLFSDNEEVLDWGYLKMGGQRLYPSEKLVDTDLYEEGDYETNG